MPPRFNTEALSFNRSCRLTDQSITLTLVLSLLASSLAAQNAPVAPALEPGKPVERELAGGQAHSYSITLASGQFLSLVVDQRGVDVVVALFAPDGKKLVEVDSPNGTQGPEPVSFIAPAAGNYRVEVRSLEKDAAPGRYVAEIKELRAATPQDKTRIAAFDAFTQGMIATGEGTAESFHRAINKFEEALPLLRELGDRADEAIALNQLGFIYKLLGDKQKALDFLNQALPLRRAVADHDGEASTLLNIGSVYDDIGEKQKAIDFYNQALPLFQSAGDTAGEAIIYNNLGLIYENLGEPQKALEFYNKALPVLRRMGNQREEANTLANMAVTYDNLGEIDKAVASYEQALSLERATGDRGREAMTLSNMGVMYDNMGDTQQALRLYQQSLPLFKLTGNRRGEANLFNKLGSAYSKLGEAQKALDFYNQALIASRAVRDRGEEATALNNIGLVHDRLGEKQKALEFYDQALPIQRAIGARRNEASTLNNIALVYDDLNQKQKSLDYYGQALALYRAIGYRHGEANTLHNIGAVYRSLGDQPKALDYYSQALPMRRAIGDRIGEAYTLHDLGSLNEDLGRLPEAFDLYNQALALHHAVGNRSGEANSLGHLARVERARGNLDEALRKSEAAIVIIESLRTMITGRDLRTSYFATVQAYYEFYIDVLMRLHKLHPLAGNDAQALQVSERGRARSLLESLAEANADIRQGIDPKLLERERSLRAQLNTKAQNQMRLLGGRHTEAQANLVAQEIESLTTEFEQVETEIRQTSPRYAALTQPQPLSLKEIQTQVLDKDTLLLEYSLGPDRSFLWAVTPNSTSSYELPKRDEIEAAARHLYDLLNARNRRIKDETTKQRETRIALADGEISAAAAAVSRMVITPVASLLGKKRLVIVADGALQYIPFAALPLPSSSSGSTPEPLIVAHEIVSLPSASSLAVIRHEVAGRRPAPKAVVALADPVFMKNDERIKRGGDKTNGEAQTKAEPGKTDGVRDLELVETAEETGVASEGLNVPRLPGSRKEAEEIVAMTLAGESKLALDFDASRTLATSAELSQYRYVHFSTHGFLNSVHPELSGIVFSLVNERGEAQDGFLRAHEVFNLKLPAELVVLSACQTGIGKEIKGEGLVSLTRGFMYAGAPRVVVSLWSVSEMGTTELMVRFYREMLKEGQPPAAALRAAQISLMKEKRWASPFYWAPFTLQGEWR